MCDCAIFQSYKKNPKNRDISTNPAIFKHTVTLCPYGTCTLARVAHKYSVVHKFHGGLLNAEGTPLLGSQQRYGGPETFFCLPQWNGSLTRVVEAFAFFVHRLKFNAESGVALKAYCSLLKQSLNFLLVTEFQYSDLRQDRILKSVIYRDLRGEYILHMVYIDCILYTTTIYGICSIYV